MLHNANVDEVTPDVLELLDELREEGKVEAIGWALGPSIGWLAEGDAAVENEFDAVQVVFNLFEQTPASTSSTPSGNSTLTPASSRGYPTPRAC